MAITLAQIMEAYDKVWYEERLRAMHEHDARIAEQYYMNVESITGKRHGAVKLPYMEVIDTEE